MSGVGIADLKAHLSERLREVRGGRTVTVLDRSTLIARMVPYDIDAPLDVRRAIRKPREMRLPPRPSRRTDGLSVLLKDHSQR